ncbi:MAG: hypothetical protein HY775_05110 [Acidobacteria bacterium]|nr:hypothetical protein [Acidobacteriota bacterium]
MSRCALCGLSFDPAASGCRGSCPVAGGCAVVCCPRCGYQTVDESRSRLAARIDRLGARLPGRRARTAGRRAGKEAAG